MTSATTLQQPTLAVSDWGWRYSGRKAWAVRDLNLEIEPGSRVMLLGASGSGKSTVLAGLAGLLTEEDGESLGTVSLGKSSASSSEARGKIALVQQDPETQIVMEQVGDEVAFGLENLGIPTEQIWSRVDRALHQVGLEVPLDRPTGALSGGEKQRLALASALAMQPSVLLLDEPTSNLDPVGVREVRESVERALADRNTTLIMVEHRLGTWVDLMDRIIVLGPGGIIADGPPGRIMRDFRDELLRVGVWVPGVEIPITPLPTAEASPALRARGLTTGYSPEDPISVGLNLDFGGGISTCLIGENGAGKSTLALTLAGLLEPLAGEVTSNGRVHMVFQEPSYQFLTSTVREELELGLDDSDRVDHYLKLLGLEKLANAHPQSLSGGEKRRLSVGTGLIGRPDILVLDEPTFGQDRNTWLNLMRLLKGAVEDGTTLIVITHDEDLTRILGQKVITLPVQAAQEREIQEEPGGALDRVNPFFRVVALLVMTVPLFVSVDLTSALVALGIELLLLPFVGWGPRKLLRRAWPLLVAAPLAGISMLLYARPTGTVYWSWGPMAVTSNSVELSFAIAIRVLALGLPAVVLLSSAKPTRMADALTQVGKLPARPVLATLAGIRLVSLMMEDWDALGRARKSRGIPPKTKLVEFFGGAFSLFTFALRRASSLSITMEARGFGAPLTRTNARKSTLCRADAVILAFAVLVPALALGASVWAGTFRWFGI